MNTRDAYRTIMTAAALAALVWLAPTAGSAAVRMGDADMSGSVGLGDAASALGAILDPSGACVAPTAAVTDDTELSIKDVLYIAQFARSARPAADLTGPADIVSATDAGDVVQPPDTLIDLSLTLTHLITGGCAEVDPLNADAEIGSDGAINSTFTEDPLAAIPLLADPQADLPVAADGTVALELLLGDQSGDVSGQAGLRRLDAEGNDTLDAARQWDAAAFLHQSRVNDVQVYCEAYRALKNWNEIETTGAEIAPVDFFGSQDLNDGYQFIDPGFDFRYFAQPESYQAVSVNGMTIPNSSWEDANLQQFHLSVLNAQSFPNASDPDGHMGVFYSNLSYKSIPGISHIYWETQGAKPDRSLVLEWKDLYSLNDAEGNSFLTFQAILGEDGAVRYQYERLDGTPIDPNRPAYGSGSAVGLEDASGGAGINWGAGVSVNKVYPNTALLLTPCNCGDDILDLGEACDNVSDPACLADCSCQAGDCLNLCGNGVMDAAGEECDDGNRVDDGNGCDADCGINGPLVGFCGDGFLNAVGEQCDDGDLDNNNDCKNDCQYNVCGDGVVNLNGLDVEFCDEGIMNGDYDHCNAFCTAVIECGDGNLDIGFEECDDTNLVVGDGCDADCVIEICGNGVTQFGEACDDANPNENDDCLSNCALASCGDGFTHNQENGTEQCDDANTTGGDGCGETCLNEICGDGQVVSYLGCAPGTQGCEECDDTNTTQHDGCDNVCVTEFCGDGDPDVGLGEDCDDGNADDFDACPNDCTLAVCGDGALEGAEECDDSNTAPDDGCSATCALECGDGVQQPLEACDDGDRDNCTTACDALCQGPAVIQCGDGLAECGEICDDNNVAEGDGCSSICTPAIIDPDRLSESPHGYRVDFSGTTYAAGTVDIPTYSGVTPETDIDTFLGFLNLPNLLVYVQSVDWGALPSPKETELFDDLIQYRLAWAQGNFSPSWEDQDLTQPTIDTGWIPFDWNPRTIIDGGLRWTVSSVGETRWMDVPALSLDGFYLDDVEESEINNLTVTLELIGKQTPLNPFSVNGAKFLDPCTNWEVCDANNKIQIVFSGLTAPILPVGKRSASPVSGCGNGVLETGEECDDGCDDTDAAPAGCDAAPSDDGDGCSSLCVGEVGVEAALCGDYLNNTIFEECDDGCGGDGCSLVDNADFWYCNGGPNDGLACDNNPASCGAGVCEKPDLCSDICTGDVLDPTSLLGNTYTIPLASASLDPAGRPGLPNFLNFVLQFPNLLMQVDNVTPATAAPAVLDFEHAWAQQGDPNLQDTSPERSTVAIGGDLFNNNPYFDTTSAWVRHYAPEGYIPIESVEVDGYFRADVSGTFNGTVTITFDDSAMVTLTGDPLVCDNNQICTDIDAGPGEDNKVILTFQNLTAPLVPALDIQRLSGCGDGAWASDEPCDDGNASNSDSCVRTPGTGGDYCAIASCGDDFVLSDNTCATDADCGALCNAGFCPYVIEGCDDAGLDGDANGCLNSCFQNACGDGVQRTSAACAENTDCLTGTCSGGLCQSDVLETCDAGPANSDNGDCTSICQTAHCGDGLVWNTGSGTENCDDGNLNNHDACVSATCQPAICGDGYIETGFEECDDGGTSNGDGCDSGCFLDFSDPLAGGAIQTAAAVGPVSVDLADVDFDGSLEAFVAFIDEPFYEFYDSNLFPPPLPATYSTNGSYALGEVARNGVWMDFNDDGAKDMVGIHSFDKNIRVRLSDGLGGFPGGTSLQAANGFGEFDGLRDLAVVDVNKDGKEDLLVAGLPFGSEGPINLYMNKGGGQFENAGSFNCGVNPFDYPNYLRIGDINGDEYPDFAVTDWSADGVAVFLGKPNNQFECVDYYYPPDTPHSLAIGDLNDDGISDLIVSALGPWEIYVAWGVGDGTFGPFSLYFFTSFAPPEWIEIADVDGDGFNDVLADGWDDLEIAFADPNAPGTVGYVHAEPLPVGCDARMFKMGDLNGDPYGPEAVHACYGSNEVISWINGFRTHNGLCGDGKVQAALGETCDDGGTATGDGCDGECHTEWCGDGVVQGGEGCDPGPTCWDGTSCSQLSDCAGIGDSLCRMRSVPGMCNDDCTCDGDCSSLCGDGLVDAYAEECDDGANGVQTDDCRDDCLFNACGDGFVRAGVEQCDDSNTIGGDGCSSDCLSDETCGNGYVDAGLGEECDDGNPDPGDGCGPTCLIERCGDGATQPANGEQCDDGNFLNEDGCSAFCKDEFCGDGVEQPGLGESCDDGGVVPGDGCDASCQVETGAIDWSVALCGPPLGVPSVADDGTIYVTADGCDLLYAFDSSGRPKWSVDLGAQLYQTLLMPNGLIAVGAQGWVLFGVDAGDSFSIVNAAPSAGNNRLLALADDDGLWVGNPSSGFLKKYGPDGSFNFNSDALPTAPASDLAVDEFGNVYAYLVNNTLVRVDPSGVFTHQSTATLNVANQRQRITLGDDGKVYVASGDDFPLSPTGQLYAFSPDCSLVWQRNVPNLQKALETKYLGNLATVVDANGRLHMAGFPDVYGVNHGDYDGELQTVDPATGSETAASGLISPDPNYYFMANMSPWADDLGWRYLPVYALTDGGGTTVRHFLAGIDELGAIQFQTYLGASTLGDLPYSQRLDSTFSGGNVVMAGRGSVLVAVAAEGSTFTTTDLWAKAKSDLHNTSRQDLCPAVGGTILSDDVESGPGTWTTGVVSGGLSWHVSNIVSNGGASSWYVGDDATRDYSASGEVWLRSEAFTLPSASTLEFDEFLQTEHLFDPFAPANYDLTYVEVLDGATDALIGTLRGTYSGTTWDWWTTRLDLSPYTGQNVKIQFRFNTTDGVANQFFGWAIDNIAVRQILCDDQCGDGALGVGEACDDGNRTPGDDCGASCGFIGATANDLFAGCGDSLVDASNEECDDGGIADGDGCDNRCRNEVCGNGVVQLGEGCDDLPLCIGGSEDGQPCYPGDNACVTGGGVCGQSDNDACRTDCTLAFCGDAVVYDQPQFCLTNADCLSSCNFAAHVCNDVLEECDDGNLDDLDACSNSCVAQVAGPCGDGVKNVGEACDDGLHCNGGTEDGNSCTADPTPCTTGGGVCEQRDNDSCTNACSFPACGDGIVWDIDGGAEVCDDGLNDGGVDECLPGCGKFQTCGDGVVDATGTEICDTADPGTQTQACTVDNNPGDACYAGTQACNALTCETYDAFCDIGVQACGNSTLEGCEDCDDVNVDEADGCLSTCVHGPILQLHSYALEGGNGDGQMDFSDGPVTVKVRLENVGPGSATSPTGTASCDAGCQTRLVLNDANLGWPDIAPGAIVESTDHLTVDQAASFICGTNNAYLDITTVADLGGSFGPDRFNTYPRSQIKVGVIDQARNPSATCFSGGNFNYWSEVEDILNASSVGRFQVTAIPDRVCVGGAEPAGTSCTEVACPSGGTCTDNDWLSDLQDTSSLYYYDTLVFPDNGVLDQHSEAIDLWFREGKNIVLIDSAVGSASCNQWLWPAGSGTGQGTYWNYESIATDEDLEQYLSPTWSAGYSKGEPLGVPSGTTAALVPGQLGGDVTVVSRDTGNFNFIRTVYRDVPGKGRITYMGHYGNPQGSYPARDELVRHMAASLYMSDFESNAGTSNFFYNTPGHRGIVVRPTRTVKLRDMHLQLETETVCSGGMFGGDPCNAIVKIQCENSGICSLGGANCYGLGSTCNTFGTCQAAGFTCPLNTVRLYVYESATGANDSFNTVRYTRTFSNQYNGGPVDYSMESVGNLTLSKDSYYAIGVSWTEDSRFFYTTSSPVPDWSSQVGGIYSSFTSSVSTDANSTSTRPQVDLVVEDYGCLVE